MTNSTSTDVTFIGAWSNRVVTKQENSHSTAPADKWIKTHPTALDITNNTISLKHNSQGGT